MPRCAILPCLLLLTLGFAAEPSAAADPDGWIPLINKDLDAWITPTMDWQWVGDVTLDPSNPRKLVGKPGEGVMWNGLKGGTRDLYTKQKYTDLEAHIEFAISKGSNSGVKMMGRYEIQITDTSNAKELTGDCCRGIYPIAEDRPFYHHIDKGIAPKVMLNDKVVHENVDVEFPTGAAWRLNKEVPSAPFMLQADHGPVAFRNVKIRPWDSSTKKD